jgi:hypothetical protein
MVTGDAAPEHVRALELVDEMVRAETAYNNPDMAYHDEDVDLSAVLPSLSQWCRDADQSFYQHLIAHRDVLGHLPRWAVHYELIDAPEEEEQPW